FLVEVTDITDEGQRDAPRRAGGFFLLVGFLCLNVGFLLDVGSFLRGSSRFPTGSGRFLAVGGRFLIGGARFFIGGARFPPCSGRVCVVGRGVTPGEQG